MEDVRKACEGIDTVFQTAAVLDFHTFATTSRRKRSYDVNVLGIQNVIEASRDAGVERLIHTSSNNVTLDGPVIDGDESTPYAERARDLYTQTKILGEKIVLDAQGKDGLLTCAIRPGGIYGPGDKLMLPSAGDDRLLVKKLIVSHYSRIDKARRERDFEGRLSESAVAESREDGFGIVLPLGAVLEIRYVAGELLAERANAFEAT
jgi:3beta-hydroxy-delta5-steroid dehydrogenase/steroid delta-isomerase